MIKINGLCVSSGDASGRVHIITEGTSKDINVDSPTILVTKLLDRNILVHMNKNIVGVIAEYGNIGSHGAGILRQLRIPCMLRINNATAFLKNGDYVEFCSAEGYIKCYIPRRKSASISSCESLGARYEKVSRHPFEINDIKLRDEWISLRPQRCYQKLRFDMFKEAHEHGPEALLGLPVTRVEQDSRGVMIEYGAPDIDDLCSYVLSHPDWVVRKAKERATDMATIKKELTKLKGMVSNKDFDTLNYVFESGIKLYQLLYKYFYMSQAISEDLLDIYLDFIGKVLGSRVGEDLLELESDYVKNSLASGFDPGISQIWNKDSCAPHIWNGAIDTSPLPVDSKILTAISHMDSQNHRYLEDYESFRIIVPLIYQLSEEYYYLSSSIHSFINWSIVGFSEYISAFYPEITVEDLYGTPLAKMRKIISDIKDKISSAE